MRSPTRCRRSPARDIATSRRCSRACTARAPAGPRPRCASSACSANGEPAQEWGRLANEHPPVLRTHDRYGNRIDEVEYLPQYHELMRIAVEHGLHGAPWADRPAGRARRARGEGDGLGRGRRRAPVPDLDDLRGRARRCARRPSWPRRTSRCSPTASYDSGLRAAAEQARPDRRHVDDREAGRLGRPRQHDPRRADRATAATGSPGTSGSPRRRCRTCSSPSRRRRAACPASSSRACCPTAPATRSSCSGSRTSSATSPTRRPRSSTTDALGWLVGDEGRGVRTIIEMVNMTRLDCALMAAGGMRLGAAHAVHHATHRARVRQARCIDQPAMRQRAGRPRRRLRGRDDRRHAARRRGRPRRARRRGRARRSAGSRLVGRRSTGCASGWRRTRPRRSSASAATATSRTRACRGCTARRRSSRSGRARATSPRSTRCARWPSEPEARRGVLRRARAGRRRRPALRRRAGAAAQGVLATPTELEFRARRVVERMALLLQGSLLLRARRPRGRRGVRRARGWRGDWGVAYGTLPAGVDTAAILDRAS